MSMKCSLTYWYLGRICDLHRYVHAAQPWREQCDRRTRVVFWEIGIWRWSWQIWPWTMTYQRNPWWSAPRG